MIMVEREDTDAVLPRAQQETTLKFFPFSVELHSSLYGLVCVELLGDSYSFLRTRTAPGQYTETMR